MVSETETPSPNGAIGRDSEGRFTVGNPGGPGNPNAAAVARFRQVFLNELTEEKLREVVGALLFAAGLGEGWAVQLVLTYAIGRPGPTGIASGDRGPSDNGGERT